MNLINEKKLKCDTDYNLYYYKTLEEFKNDIDNVKKESNNMKEYISNYIEIVKNTSDELKTKIDDYLNYMNLANTIKNNANQSLIGKQNHITKINDIFKKLIDNLILIQNNNHINNIKELNEKLVNKMNCISNLDFNPPNVNSVNISSTKVENNDSKMFNLIAIQMKII